MRESTSWDAHVDEMSHPLRECTQWDIHPVSMSHSLRESTSWDVYAAPTPHSLRFEHRVGHRRRARRAQFVQETLVPGAMNPSGPPSGPKQVLVVPGPCCTSQANMKLLPALGL